MIDDILEDCSVEELQEELPERQPRYPCCNIDWLHEFPAILRVFLEVYSLPLG